MDPKLKAAILNDIGGSIVDDVIGGEVVTEVELANEFNDITLLVSTETKQYRLTATLVTILSAKPK